jgi:hypothetical protein
MTTHYKQTKDHPNWSLETPRQSYITGTWAEQREPVDTIPPIAYLVGLAALAALFLAAYL